MESFSIYVREISGNSSKRGGLLTKNQEIELGIAIQNGDMKARDELVEANLRLVFFIAKRFISKTNAIEDLVSEGNIGLINAANTFDPKRDVRFSTYAHILIKYSIMKFKIMTEFIGIAGNAHPYFKLKKIRSKYISKYGVSIPNELAAEMLDVPVEKLLQIIDDGQRGLLSMTSIVDDEDVNLEEVIPSNEEPIEESISKQQAGIRTLELIDKCNLDDRERHIVFSHLGLNRREPKMLSDIARDLKISGSRVSQLYDRAIRKIKFKAIKTKFHSGYALTT